MNTLRCRSKILSLEKPLTMAIINATPDSFSDGSPDFQLVDLQKKVSKAIENGAEIIDIGGQSTRPGAKRISAEEEWGRVKEILQWTVNQNIIVSLDTFYPEVAEKALDLGVHIINDVLCEEPQKMFQLIAKYQATYVIMHSKGTPENMQINPEYHDVVQEVCEYFLEKIKIAESYGCYNLILDLGFGFGKTLEHNYELLRNISIFKTFGYPLLIGISRKSMISKLFHQSWKELESVQEVLHFEAMKRGGNIFRVHDIELFCKTKKVYELIK